MRSPWETDVVDVADEGGRSEPPVPSEGAEEERLLMSPGAYAAAAVALMLIGLVGFVSNLLVMVLMCRNKQLWTPLNAILFNLVCSDFSVSVLGNPITLTAALFRRWIFGRTICVIYGFFMSLLGIASITTLMVLSFERYVMISKPFQVKRLSQKGALGLIGAIWIYSLILTAPPLFGWGDYVNESANISCSVNWESKTISATTYIIFLFAMGLVVPVIVICFSYMNIIWTMKKNAIAMGRVTKAETRVALMVFVMIVAFLVAWTPYSVLALLVAFGDASLVSPGIAVVPALMAKSSICYNPIIYVGLNTQFRSAWHKLLGVRAISETSQEVGGEHTAMLSPSHYMSHTLLDGGAATGTTSASTGGLLLNAPNSPSPANAAAFKRRPGVAQGVGANGDAARPSSNIPKIAEVVPEEGDEVRGEEKDEYDDAVEETEEEMVEVSLEVEMSPGEVAEEGKSEEGPENEVDELLEVIITEGEDKKEVSGKGEVRQTDEVSEGVRGGEGAKGKKVRGRGRRSSGCGGGESGRGPRRTSGLWKGVNDGGKKKGRLVSLRKEKKGGARSSQDVDGKEEGAEGGEEEEVEMKMLSSSAISGTDGCCGGEEEEGDGV